MKKLIFFILILVVVCSFGFAKYQWIKEGESFFLMSVNGKAYELSFLIPRTWKPVGTYYNTNNWLFVECAEGKLRTVRLRSSGSAYMHEYRFEIDLPKDYGNVSAFKNSGLTDDQIGVKFTNGKTCIYEVTPENGIVLLETSSY